MPEPIITTTELHVFDMVGASNGIKWEEIIHFMRTNPDEDVLSYHDMLENLIRSTERPKKLCTRYLNMYISDEIPSMDAPKSVFLARRITGPRTTREDRHMSKTANWNGMLTEMVDGMDPSQLTPKSLLQSLNVELNLRGDAIAKRKIQDFLDGGVLKERAQRVLANTGLLEVCVVFHPKVGLVERVYSEPVDDGMSPKVENKHIAYMQLS